MGPVYINEPAQRQGVAVPPERLRAVLPADGDMEDPATRRRLLTHPAASDAAHPDHGEIRRKLDGYYAKRYGTEAIAP